MYRRSALLSAVRSSKYVDHIKRLCLQHLIGTTAEMDAASPPGVPILPKIFGILLILLSLLGRIAVDMRPIVDDTE